MGFWGILDMLHSDLDTELSRQYGWIALQISKTLGSASQRYRETLETNPKLSSLIESCKDFDPLDARTHKLVDWARRNEVAAVRYILGRHGHSVDINERDRGKTAIHFATSAQNVEMVWLLLGAGADLRIRDSSGVSQAATATRDGCSEILDIFIRHDLDAVRATSVGLGIFYGDRSLLMVAAERGHINCVQLILKALPFSLQLRSEKGDNALGMACKAHMPVQDPSAVVDVLLKSGIDTRNQNRDGMNALHIAADRRLSHAVNSILSSGMAIDVNTQDGIGRTALHYAMGDSTGIAETLIRVGADPSIRDKEGHTALEVAILHDQQIAPDDESVRAICRSGKITPDDAAEALKIAAQVGRSDFSLYYGNLNLPYAPSSRILLQFVTMKFSSG
ncbi:hypothetical protein TWF481_003362 [Arthrobotrys musiformis]|uniref:Ankyrin n=1 Tax=Arthrobotrys musiformis TaxID=47236 RepID=A0AAV9VQA1_9PEZI